MIPKPAIEQDMVLVCRQCHRLLTLWPYGDALPPKHAVMAYPCGYDVYPMLKPIRQGLVVTAEERPA